LTATQLSSLENNFQPLQQIQEEERTKKMSVEDKLKELEQYKILSNQPSIEAVSEYVAYETGSFSNPLNFEDRDGFQTKITKEAQSIAKLVCFLIFY
jgi:hypothetical protein